MLLGGRLECQHSYKAAGHDLLFSNFHLAIPEWPPGSASEHSTSCVTGAKNTKQSGTFFAIPADAIVRLVFEQQKLSPLIYLQLAFVLMRATNRLDISYRQALVEANNLLYV